MPKTIRWLIIAAALTLPSVAVAHLTPFPHFHIPYPEMRLATTRAEELLRHAQIGTSQVGGRHAVLTVWNPSGKRSDIRLVNIRDGISKTKGFKVVARPINGLVSKLGIEPWNGVNTRYVILEPHDWYALMIKTNTRSVAGAIYFPYNPAYQTPEMAAAGRLYLEQTIRRAEAVVGLRVIKSRRVPSKLVTENLDTDISSVTKLDTDARVLATLLIIEHIDVEEFRARGAGWTADKVLVTLALNRERTYRYAISAAGAGGIAQFIRPTYEDIRTRYSEAKLPTVFEEAMADHMLAIVSQYCLIDRALNTLEEQTGALPTDHNLLGWYLAAAYNAGEHRAIPAYREYKRCVAAASKTRPTSKCVFSYGLPEETKNYVREFSAVYEYLFH